MDNQHYEDILKQEKLKEKRIAIIFIIFVLGILICIQQFEIYNVTRMAKGFSAMGTFVAQMVPPDFSDASSWIVPVYETLAMSVGGTLLAILLSLPLAFLAKANRYHRAFHIVIRGIHCLLRAVPDLILGLLFVTAVGFGTLPGMLAIAFHSTGILGRSFVETIEGVDKEPIETLRATGASSVQIFRYAILPQIFLKITELCLSRWEYNVRISTIMGIVGAGGIGVVLVREIDKEQYQKVFAILIVIITTLVIIDLAGSQFRKHLK